MNGPESRDEEIWSDVEPEAGDPRLAVFEADLERALRPIELPAGFSERVLAAAAAAEQPRRGRILPFRSWRLAMGGAIAAAVLAGSFVGTEMYQGHERARERALATQQFETATRITDQALAHTREQLQQAGVFRED